MMKIIDIAIKDLTRSFRSAFALVFMFIIPLIIPVMFFFMFGNIARNDQAFSIPVTRVVVVNLDKGSPEFNKTLVTILGAAQAQSMGELVSMVLQRKEFANMLQVTTGTDADAAREAVDTQQAGVAIILPIDLSAQFSDQKGQATIEFYQDPTQTIGPGVVKSILKQFMDGISGARITVNMSMAQTGKIDPVQIGQVISQYLAAQPQGDPTNRLLNVVLPAQAGEAQNPVLVIVGMVMGAMLIFYAYYTGVATAQGILVEDEKHTLQRLFTTPTQPSAILTGKFLGVLITVSAQVIILLIAARLIFQVNWGSGLAVSMISVCIILNAAAFGIFINSLLRNSKQAGAVFGGVLTLTTWVGAMPIFLGFSGNTNPAINMVSLTMPQGWIVRMLMEGANNAPMNQILLSGLVSLAWTAIFFLIGVLRFRRRFA
jgi:ABC-2 type transport system permease protein